MKDCSQPYGQLELDEIRSRYARRDKPIPSWKRTYYRRIRDDRETVYRDIVGNHFSNPEQLRFLEIGAGTGGNLGFFHSLGIPWRNIYANELLADRIRHLQNDFPSEMKVIAGNALDVSDRHFDLVLVSTVFSSILDDAFRTTLAARLLQMLSDQGIILWYDFVYQNPLNRDVRGIRESDVRSLFKGASQIQFWHVSLLPPIAVLVGPLYGLFRRIPLLRSHLIAKISNQSDHRAAVD